MKGSEDKEVFYDYEKKNSGNNNGLVLRKRQKPDDIRFSTVSLINDSGTALPYF